MVVLTALGVCLAAYLTYVHYAGLKPVCTAGQSCIKVQTSQWSRLDGVPVALIGLIGYVLILGSLLVPDREESRLATLALTLIGFGFSGYLTYRELYSIHAVCEECATSAVILTVLFAAAVAHYLMGPGAATGPAAATGPVAATGTTDAGRPAAANAAEPSSKAVSATLRVDGQ